MAIKIFLQPQYQRLAQDISTNLREYGYDFLLLHQDEHFRALGDYHIVVNTNPTGTGKTLASLLHLLRLQMQQADSGNSLMVAPTNELLAQHTQDVKEFIKLHKLPHIVLNIQATTITKLCKANKWRRGEAFFELLRNPRNPLIAPHLDVEGDLNRRSPIFVVTNPDLFYYALQGTYNQLDRRNLMMRLIGSFSYLIVDELHYYSPKQAAAFFLYLALAAKFNFFEEGFRVSFLTATPEPLITDFFHHIDTLGLRVKMLAANHTETSDTQVTMSTAEVELIFQASDEGIEPIIKEHKEKIRSLIADNRDVAIISHSLVDISAVTRLFHDKEYQTVTGAVEHKWRQKAVLSPLILATPTVDIGYNFPRTGKLRQGLDDIFFIAFRDDEFWQRIGRVGRVIRKSEHRVTSTATCVVTSAIYENLEKLQIANKTLSRTDLSRLLTDKEVFPPRKNFWSYVVTEGFFENGHALFELSQTFTMERKPFIEDAYQFLQKIFAAAKAPSWKSVRARIARFHSLEKETQNINKNKPEFPTNLLKEFACEKAIRNAGSLDEENSIISKTQSFPESSLSLLRDRLRTGKQLRETFFHYIKQEHAALAGIFSFRETFSGPTALVYDRHRIFHPNQLLTTYDLFHLIKNYQVFIYSGKETFINDLKKNGENFSNAFNEDCNTNLFLRIDKVRERANRLQLCFQLEVDNLDTFEKFDTDCLRAFDNLRPEFLSRERTIVSVVPLEPQIEEAVKKEFIPMLIFSENIWIKLAGRIRKAGFWCFEIKVKSSNNVQEKSWLMCN